MSNSKMVTTQAPRNLCPADNEYDGWEIRSFMQALVLMTVTNSDKALSREEIINKIGEYVYNEYLSEHVDDALLSLMEVTNCCCFDEPQLDDNLEDKEGCPLYRLATDAALKSTKTEKKCAHACQCACHKGKKVLHITTCCAPCKACKQSIRTRDANQHSKICHRK